jgi:hypothetical protein
MITECIGCSQIIGVKCPQCGNRKPVREPMCGVIDLLENALGSPIKPERVVYVCLECVHTFNAGDGGVSHGWCAECERRELAQLEAAVRADREYSSGERE